MSRDSSCSRSTIGTCDAQTSATCRSCCRPWPGRSRPCSYSSRASSLLVVLVQVRVVADHVRDGDVLGAVRLAVAAQVAGAGHLELDDGPQLLLGLRRTA